MAQYRVRAVLATPFYDEDEDTVYDVVCETKRELNKLEKSFVKALQHLTDLTEKELNENSKEFSEENEQTVTFEVNLFKDGTIDFGGYLFRWPNQSEDARAYLKGMFDGIMDENGKREKKLKKRKARD